MTEHSEAARPPMGGERLQRALDLWLKINGIEGQSALKNSRMGLRDWDVREQCQEIQQALDLDPSELTGLLLLTQKLNAHMRESTVTLFDAMHAAEALAAELAPCRELYDLLHQDDLVMAKRAFIAQLGTALKAYGADSREDIQEVLGSDDDLALLRRDALRSMEKLRVDQFLKGHPESETSRPKYVKDVHQWWNVNSMLAASARMPSGVSVNLVRHPDDYQSYFAFVIRNGGNIFVLSDIDDYAHPLQGYMTRRPERRLTSRAERNWFPYDLLGAKYDPDSGRLYIQRSKQTGLVPYQSELLPLAPIRALDPPTVVWLAMMFDLIVERFWRKGWQAKALSYTGEMLKAPNALSEVAATANLPVERYRRIPLKALTLNDVFRENVSESEVGKMGESHNAWLEDRYRDRVSVESLNLVSPPEIQHVLSTEGRIAVESGSNDAGAASGSKMEAYNATSFGRRGDIQRDRLFIARVNFANQIGKLAAEEYEARREQVLTWYEDHVRANQETVIAWTRNDNLYVDEGVQDWGTRFKEYAGPIHSVTVKCSREHTIHEPSHQWRCFMRRLLISDLEYGGLHFHRSLFIRKPGSPGDRLFRCAVTGAKATYLTVFYPAQATELALLCGCEVGDLPDVLQHWTLREPYTGNSILSRIDPMNWRIGNPWAKSDFRVVVPLSKRGLSTVLKASDVGVPHGMFLEKQDVQTTSRRGPRRRGFRC